MERTLGFAFGALLPCVYILGWTGFSIETNWFMLWTILPLAMFAVRIRPTPAHWIGAAFLAWAALSLAWTPSSDWAIEAALKLGAGVCAFLLGSEVEDDEWLFRGFAVGIAINSAVAVAQYFGWFTDLASGTPSGLLYNGNALAEPAALIALVLLLDGRVLWALPTIPAIVLPGTRAGVVILGVGFLAWLWTKHRVAALALLGISAVVVGVSLDRGWRAPSTAQRVSIWQDTISGINPLGHGLGSFGRDYPKYATHINTALERPFHAHSDLLEVTFELGILGLALFAAFLGACWLGARPRESILLAPCLLLLALDFPLYVPTSSFIVAFLAGRATGGWRERSVVGLKGRSGLAPSDEVRRSIRPNRSKRQVSV